MRNSTLSSPAAAETASGTADRLHLIAAYTALGLIALVSFGTLIMHLG